MKSFGRLLMAAALIVPLGVATASSAGATQGNGGHFDCNSSAGSMAFRPGLLLNKSRDQRITGAATVACTSNSVTGGSMTFNLNEEKLRCPKLAKGPAGTPGGSAGTVRVIWNKKDKAGQSLLTVNFLVTATSGHTTSGTISGSVRMGAIAVGKTITGTFAIDKGLNSVPKGGDCATLKPLTGANITAIEFKTS